MLLGLKSPSFGTEATMASPTATTAQRINAQNFNFLNRTCVGSCTSGYCLEWQTDHCLESCGILVLVSDP